MNAFMCNSKSATHVLVQCIFRLWPGILYVKKVGFFCIISISVTKKKTLKNPIAFDAIRMKMGDVYISFIVLILNSSDTTNVHAYVLMFGFILLTCIKLIYSIVNEWDYVAVFLFVHYHVRNAVWYCVSTRFSWLNVGMCVCIRVCLRIMLIKYVFWHPMCIKSENSHASG